MCSETEDELHFSSTSATQTNQSKHTHSQMTADTPKQGTDSTTVRLYIFCPYEERNDAKALGARWDSYCKRWFAPSAEIYASLARWHGSPSKERKRKYNNDSSDTLSFLQSFRLNYPKMTGEFESHGIELKVPFRHRKRAKELGVRWNGHSWRIPVHATQDTIRDTLACFPMDLSRENFTGD